MNENQPPTEENVPEDRGASSEPEWLRDMSGDQESPDWLRRLFREQDDAGVPADADLSVQKEPDEDPPAVEPEEPLDADSGRSGTDELRQWFRSAEGESGPPDDKEDLPEWLQALDATGPSSEEPGLPDVPPAGSSQDDVPSWLRDLDKEPEPAVAAASGSQSEEPLPDWLLSLDEGSDAEETGAPEDVDARAPGRDADDLPDWLIEMREEVAGEPQGAAVSAPGAPEPPEEPELLEEPEPSEDAAVPVWGALDAGAASQPAASQPAASQPAVPQPGETQEPAEPEPIVAEPGSEDAAPELEPPLWLTELDQELADEMPVPADVPSVPEAEDEAAIPEWLAELEETPIEGSEAPEWVLDLRGEQDVEREAEDELEVETSGPLAGLTGLLSPPPLAGLSSKAVARPAPVIPEGQHVLAARVREMLSEPPSRPELSVAAPARTVMRALGNWLMYLALVVVIVAAMFVPALQNLVVAPETAASKDFYVTLLSLPPGSEVLLVIDYDAAHDGELTPLTRVLLWHLLTSGQRVVVVSHTPQGTAMAEDLLASRALWAYGPAPAAGEQVLNLGYLPPHPASMQAFMANPLGGVALWGKGARPQETFLGQEIAGFDDLDAIVLVSASQAHTRWWIEQTRRSAPTVAAVSASIAPTLLPYYGPPEGAQLDGMLVGLAGAAEYERLCEAGFTPNARQNMILQGSAQLLLAAIVLVSGLSLVARRAFGRKGERLA